MKTLWDRRGIVAATLLFSLAALGTGAKPETYRGFVGASGKRCHLALVPSHRPDKLLNLDSDLCALMPHLVGLYVKVLGVLAPCAEERTKRCLRITELQPELYDPLSRR